MGCEWNATDCDDTLSTAASDIDAHVGEKADMSAYESYDADTDYVFINSDVENMLQRMNNGDTFVTFFGFSSCPWCRDAMPILNAVALDEGYEVDYINTRLDPSWESNLDLKDYDKLVDALGDLFPVDDDGKAHLDVPFVVFFKDGKVAASAGNGVNPIQGLRLIFLLVAREEAAAFASAKKPLSGKESEIFNMCKHKRFPCSA